MSNQVLLKVAGLAVTALVVLSAAGAVSAQIGEQRLHLNPVIAKLAEGRTVYGLQAGIEMSIGSARAAARAPHSGSGTGTGASLGAQHRLYACALFRRGVPGAGHAAGCGISFAGGAAELGFVVFVRFVKSFLDAMLRSVLIIPRIWCAQFLDQYP